MKSYLSPHASKLLDDIVDTIADALSITDALRWNDNIHRTILTLEDHPLSDPNGVQRRFAALDLDLWRPRIPSPMALSPFAIPSSVAPSRSW